MTYDSEQISVPEMEKILEGAGTYIRTLGADKAGREAKPANN